MAKTKEQASGEPKVEQNGSWYTITDADGEEHKVQGEDAYREKMAELGHPVPEDDETEEEETSEESPEKRDLTPEEAHFEQARKSQAVAAGEAKTGKPVVPAPPSDTVRGDEVTSDPQTANDDTGPQTANDGRGPATAESLSEEAAKAKEEEEEEDEVVVDEDDGLETWERQEKRIAEAEKQGQARPAVAAALAATESNITLRSGVPTGPTTHPSGEPEALDGTEPGGESMRGFSAPQKTADLLGVDEGSSDEEE